MPTLANPAIASSRRYRARGRRMAAPRRFERRDGLTLGVVSRLAPLKQFPALFERLVPVLARHPRVESRDLRYRCRLQALAALQDALSPLGPRVRYWGFQRDVARAYRALDYLLTGLAGARSTGTERDRIVPRGDARAGDRRAAVFRDAQRWRDWLHVRRSAQRWWRGLRARASWRRRPAPCRSIALPRAAHLEGFSFPRFAARVDGVMENVVAAGRSFPA